MERDFGDQQKHICRHGQFAKAVGKFLTNILDFLRAGNAGDTLVHPDAREAILDVVFGQVGIHADFHSRLNRLFPRAAAQGVHRLAHETHIRLEADLGDKAVLFFAEQVARPANLEVAHRQLVTAAEVAELLEGLEPAHGFLRYAAIRGYHEEGLRQHAAAAHAPTHLVKLAYAKVMRVHDDNRIRVRNIQAGFNNARTYQDIEFLREEAFHHAFQVAVVHLPVGNSDAGFRHPRFHIFSQHVDVLHAVVHHEHLATARKFVADGGRQHHVVALQEFCLYRQAVHRGRIDKRNVAHARHAQVQRTRNRCSAHTERINRHAELAQLFLLLHAKLLLFVNHEQAQVLELVLFVQECMRTDDNVNLPFGNPLENLTFFLRRLVAVYKRDIHREGSKAVAEILVVLCRKDSRRHENRHLLLGGNALEGGAHGNFRLAEAHVTTDKAVHRTAAFHVALDFGGSLHLVGCRVVLEGILEFLLHLAIGRERKAIYQFALRIEFHEVARNLHHLLLDALLEVFPRLAAKAVEFRRFAFARFEPFDFLQVRYRELETVTAIVFQQGAVHETTVHLYAHKPEVTAHAVVLMRHQVAAVERFHHQGSRHRARNLALARFCRMAVKNTRFRKEGDLVVIEPKTFSKVSDKVILNRQSGKDVL